MTITLTPAQEQALQQAIESGIFRSVDDFLNTALQTLNRLPLAGVATASSDQDETLTGLVRKGRFLIYLGTPKDDYDVLKAIEQVRDEHSCHLIS